MSSPATSARPIARRRRADGELTRRRVLDATVEAILELGYYQASTNEIARRAGVTWGALQHQFGTREALLLEVLDDRFTTLEHAVAEADIRGDTLEERLAEVLDLLESFYGEPEHLAGLQIVLDLSRNPRTSAEARAAVAEHGSELTRVWGPLFARALGEASAEDDLVRYAFVTLRAYHQSHLVASNIADTRPDAGVKRLLVAGVAASIRAEAHDRGISVD